MTNIFGKIEELVIEAFLWLLDNLLNLFVLGYLVIMAKNAWVSGHWQVSVFFASGAFLYVGLVLLLLKREKGREERRQKS